jgi:nucleoside-diphosphate-sugar epimerase
LNDERRLAESVAGCDAVIHLAGLAHQPVGSANLTAEFRRINIEGTRFLACAAARSGVRKFVFLSSIAAICTRSDTPIDDGTPCAPVDSYGCSKLEAEEALVLQCKDSETDWCILRPPLVYGPGNPGNMRKLMWLISTGLPLPFGSIRNRRSFIFVDNLVDAMISVLPHQGVVRSTYVVSDGSDFSTPEFVRALSKAAGRSARLLAIPVSALTFFGRVGDAANFLFGSSIGLNSNAIDRLVSSLPVDGSRFRDYFDWHPPVGIGLAVEQTGQAFAAPRAI